MEFLHQEFDLQPEDVVEVSLDSQANVILAGPDAVVLYYFGAVANTEWDERFVRLDGVWGMDKSNQPRAAPDTGCV